MATPWAWAIGYRPSLSLLQEADETQLWIELLIEDCHVHDPNLSAIHRETGELIAIFTTMVSNVRRSL